MYSGLKVSIYNSVFSSGAPELTVIRLFLVFVMENRKNIRIPFAIKSVIKFNETEIDGTVLNISLQGIFIDVPGSIPEGTVVVVELMLEGHASHRKLQLPGQIVRSGPDETAVKLITMKLDSYIELRDLLMNCSEDPDTIMKEFINIITRY